MHQPPAVTLDLLDDGVRHLALSVHEVLHLTLSPLELSKRRVGRNGLGTRDAIVET